MRRLSSISQRPSSRAAATAWSSPWMVSRMHHDPQIVGRDAGAAQRHEFRDRIILAIAAARASVASGERPDVDLAVLGEVAHRPDGEIDGAVDLAEPGAALAEPGGVDDVEEFQRGRRHAAFAVALAQRELHHFVVEAALHAEPFVAQSAAGERGCGKPERLGRSLDQIPPAADGTGVSARRSPVRTRPCRTQRCPHAMRAKTLTTPSDAPCPGIGWLVCLLVTGSFRWGQDGRGGF